MGLRVYMGAGVWRGVGLDDVVPADPFELGVTKPDSTWTGPRIAVEDMTVVVGDLIVTTPGQLVKGYHVLGRIQVRAPNVTVEDCLVELQSGTVLSSTVNMIDTTHSGARNTTVRFCEVSAADAPSVWINGIGPKSATVWRSNIHDVVDGMSVSDSTGNNDPVSIEGSYIHDLFYITPDPTHSDNQTHRDGIQSQGGPVTLLIDGCNIQGFDSPNSTDGGSANGRAFSCVMLNTASTRFKTNVTITRNWFDGGADSINGRGTDGGTIVIRQNRFGTNLTYFPITTNITLSSTWVVPTTGEFVNTWEGTGAALSNTATFTQSSGTQTIRRYY